MFITTQHPDGPQPTTYGYLQVIVNLIDEWSLVIYWGHKTDANPFCMLVSPTEYQILLCASDIISTPRRDQCKPAPSYVDGLVLCSHAFRLNGS